VYSLVVLTGASGAGKTTIAQRIEAMRLPNHVTLHFDSIGIPSPDEMRNRYGIDPQPGGGWQRAMTQEWMKRIRPIVDLGNSVLFEGQMRISFIIAALAGTPMDRVRVFLVDCDDRTRIDRLSVNRMQPELAGPDMLNWARYLRSEAEVTGIEILDTSYLSVRDSVEIVLQQFCGNGDLTPVAMTPRRSRHLV
jgi:RNase adaptor protein for sRNA GlmZ degradation